MSNSSPTHLAVLLFTDIVGSTELKDHLGTATYRRLLARHNELFETGIAQVNDARIIKHTGNGYFASFPTASAAVRFALRFQTRMALEPWDPRPLTTRVGIHIGEVAPMDMAGREDVIGLSADLASRLMSLAAGGQILLTAGAFNDARQFVSEGPAELSDRCPPLKWIAHGRYVFQGSDEPLEVFEVGSENFSPLKAPPDSQKAKRAVPHDQEPTLGWRPAQGLDVPGRPGWILESKLGEGGFGEAWLGRHSKLPERRVFKFCFNAERLRSFKREITLFRLLRDALGDRPDIAKLYEIKLDEPPFFLESEYTNGGNLVQWAEAKGGIDKVPLSQRLEIVAQVADGVAAAHSIGVLHKDIKPSNILMHIGPGGAATPRLSDFGIGILADRSLLAAHQITETGFTQITQNDSSRTGTRLYAPPEQMAGGPFTTAGDVYALGVLIYQMAVADLGRPLALGWEREVPDGILRRLIASAADGQPARRIPGAGIIAEDIRSIDKRRAQSGQRVRRRALSATIVLVLLLANAGYIGLLGPIDGWWSDARSRYFQHFVPMPTKTIVHFDNDDAALSSLGRWPWPRSMLADMVRELNRAGAKVIAFDVIFPESEGKSPLGAYDENLEPSKVDLDFADALRACSRALLPVSFLFKTKSTRDHIHEVVRKVLSRNLELDRSELPEALRAAGEASIPPDVAMADFVRAREEAMLGRLLSPQLAGKTIQEVRQILLPNSQIASQSPTLRLLRTQYDVAQSIISLLTKSRTEFPGLPPLLEGSDTLQAPIAVLANASRYEPFVNFLPGKDGVVRTVPLWIRYRGRLIPQLGMALACAALDVDVNDPKQVEITPDRVIIHPPNGSLIPIPVATLSTESYGTTGLQMYIPWVGKSWKSVYGTDAQGNPLRHHSLSMVWDVWNLRRIVANNAMAADEAVVHLLDGVDLDKKKAYQQRSLSLDNIDVRESAMREGIKLADEQFMNDFRKMSPDNQRKLPDDQLKYVDAYRAVRALIDFLPASHQQFDVASRSLQAAVQNRAVLIGSIATGAQDQVATSIDLATPGLMVHSIIFNAIMTRRFPREAPRWCGALAIIVLGTATALLVAYMSPWASLVVTIGIWVVFMAFDGLILFDRLQFVLDAAGAGIPILSVWPAQMIARGISKRIERRGSQAGCGKPGCPFGEAARCDSR